MAHKPDAKNPEDNPYKAESPAGLCSSQIVMGVPVHILVYVAVHVFRLLYTEKDGVMYG